jgi:protein-tyrosine phosphatase
VIDLHAHILPGVDDGAASLDVALEMARIAASNGVTVQACTPHVLPGLYDNCGPQIRLATRELQARLDERGVALRLVSGADAHIVPDMVERLREGSIPSLAETRYVLVEPPHQVPLPRIASFFSYLSAAGYAPILTHPERLAWIETHYPVFVELFRSGVWMQVTAGSLTGAFGRRPKYWAERMLDEGLVHILASDAHGVRRRPPDLAEGRAAAAKWLGEDEAEQLVQARPSAVLSNADPFDVKAPVGAGAGVAKPGAVARSARARRSPAKVEASRSRCVHRHDQSRRLPLWMRRLFVEKTW